MKILIDENLDRRLAHQFPEYDVKTVQQMNWSGAKNGQLLKLMKGKFDVLITADQNLITQQSKALTNEIAVIVLKALKAPTNRLKDHIVLIPKVKQALLEIKKGEAICIQ
jgi:predicted nuclease of predicted toxin-antitoxin system